MQKLYKEKIRVFTEKEIIPCAGKFDKEEKIPIELIKNLAMEGYLGAMLPKKYGGSELDFVMLGILNEEIGKGCSSTRSLLTVHGMVALAILKWGTEEQKAFWLPKLATGEKIAAFALTEFNIGSDAKSIEMQAELSEDCYILNGQKKWITFGQVADLFLIFAQLNGKPTAFLVESHRIGFSKEPISGLLGFRASMAAELKMENCIIPKENLLGNIGFGLSHVALNSLDYGRYTVAFGCVGLGEACLEDCLSYVRKRKQFGNMLRHYQLIQKMITEMIVNIKAARMLCYSAGYLKDIGDSESIMETWAAKYYASKMAVDVAKDAVQIHGANGCCDKYNVERYYRDAKVMEIIEGTSQMHEVFIALNSFKN